MSGKECVGYAYVFTDPLHPECWRGLGYEGRELVYSLLVDKRQKLPEGGEMEPSDTLCYVREKLKARVFGVVFESRPEDGLPHGFSP